MSALIRFNVIESHLVSRFPQSSTDPALDESRKLSPNINPEILARNYFAKPYNNIVILRERMRKSALFNHEENYVTDLEFTRGRVVEQLKFLFQEFKISYERDLVDPGYKGDITYPMAEYSLSLSTRLIVHMYLYIDSIQGLGTEKHRELINRAYAFKDYGCFAMTELGHGSNVNGVETIATYDPKTNGFILNSPTRTSAKWWVGALANTANMAVVFAQLIVDKVNRGVHVFLIPIRDYKTHEVLPGLVIGDCGKKISLDGIDNGYMLFNNYHVSYDCLLDKFSQIRDGKFKSSIKNKDKRLGVMMAGLIRGRLSVISGSEINARNCVTIALRYAGLRKQFGGQVEKSILSYQTHQYRLVIGLSKSLAMRCGAGIITRIYEEIRPMLDKDPECDEVNELHSLLSAMKVVASTMSTGITQDCRTACGGHGFSSYSSIGRYRGYQDIHNTWEGDNHVLIQQTGRYILKILQKSFKGQNVVPKTLSFLKFDFEEVKKFHSTIKSKTEAESPQALIDLLQFRINYLMHLSVLSLQENASKATDMTEAWNNSQVFLVQDLGHAYGELIMASEFFRLASNIQAECKETGKIVEKLGVVFSIDRIINNISTFIDGALSHAQEKILKETLLGLCSELAFAAIKVADALAAPDELIGSVIGARDGQAYDRMINAVEKEPGCYTIPKWLNVLRELRGG